MAENAKPQIRLEPVSRVCAQNILVRSARCETDTLAAGTASKADLIRSRNQQIARLSTIPIQK